MKEFNEKIKQESEIFFKNIQYLKKKEHLSQKELAKIGGVSVSSIRKLLNGILPNISCSIIFKIAEHFSLHPRDLFLPINKDK